MQNIYPDSLILPAICFYTLVLVARVVAAELSERTLPNNLSELVQNYRISGRDLAADFFFGVIEKFGDYQIVNPDGHLKDIETMQIPENVLEDMFLAVRTKGGQQAYKSPIKLKEFEPAELYRLQTFVFRDKLDSMGRDVNKRYGSPAILLDHGSKEFAIYMPPIVEEHSGKKVLIDGMHRTFIAYENSEKILAVYIEKPLVPLPAEVIGTVEGISDNDILGYYVPTGSADHEGRPKFYGLNKGLFRMYNYCGFGKFDKKKAVIGEAD